MFGLLVKLFICTVTVSVLLRVVFLWRLVRGSLLDNVWISTIDSGGVAVINTPNIIPYTTDLAPYGYDVTNNTFIQFEVESCRDAFVTLIVSNDTPVLYELEIGINYNTNTHLLVQNGPVSERVKHVSTKDILDCNQFRSFWLKWEVNGKIRFGTGSILLNQELFYWTPGTADSPIFKSIAIRSSWGANATWIIHNKANPIGKFCGRANTFADMAVLEIAVMDSVVKCTAHCRQNNDCLAVNFHNFSHECRLIRGNQLIATSNRKNWIFMTNCLQGINACIACI